MTVSEYVFPEVIDLRCAGRVADELAQVIRATSAPVANMMFVQRGGIALLQILIGARRMSEAERKTFIVLAAPDGVLATLLSDSGLEPVSCGVRFEIARNDASPADPAFSAAAPSLKRT